MFNKQILILSDGKMYGPFDEQATTQAWLDNHPTTRSNCELYSVWPPSTVGTAEVAHECGIRLQTIEEASALEDTGRRSAGRKTSGA